MPAKQRRRLHQQSDQSCPIHNSAQRRHDHPISGFEIRPLHLPAQNAKLMTEQKQLRFRVANSQPYIDDVEKQSKAGVEKRE